MCRFLHILVVSENQVMLTRSVSESSQMHKIPMKLSWNLPEKIQLLPIHCWLSLCVCLLYWWFSKLGVYTDHPEIFLKCRFRFNISQMGPRFCISNKLPCDADVVAFGKLSLQGSVWNASHKSFPTGGTCVPERYLWGKAYGFWEWEIHPLSKGCMKV